MGALMRVRVQPSGRSACQAPLAVGRGALGRDKVFLEKRVQRVAVVVDAGAISDVDGALAAGPPSGHRALRAEDPEFRISRPVELSGFERQHRRAAGLRERIAEFVVEILAAIETGVIVSIEGMGRAGQGGGGVVRNACGRFTRTRDGRRRYSLTERNGLLGDTGRKVLWVPLHQDVELEHILCVACRLLHRRPGDYG